MTEKENNCFREGLHYKCYNYVIEIYFSKLGFVGDYNYKLDAEFTGLTFASY